MPGQNEDRPGLFGRLRRERVEAVEAERQKMIDKLKDSGDRLLDDIAKSEEIVRSAGRLVRFDTVGVDPAPGPERKIHSGNITFDPATARLMLGGAQVVGSLSGVVSTGIAPGASAAKCTDCGAGVHVKMTQDFAQMIDTEERTCEACGYYEKYVGGDLKITERNQKPENTVVAMAKLVTSNPVLRSIFDRCPDEIYSCFATHEWLIHQLDIDVVSRDSVFETGFIVTAADGWKTRLLVDHELEEGFLRIDARGTSNLILVH